MKYLMELVKDNGHQIVLYSKAQENRKYISVFDYSVKYGGTYDGFRYYNNYVVELNS